MLLLLGSERVEALGEDLRHAIGQLVRAARARDTMAPGEVAILGCLDRGGAQATADLAHGRGVSHQSAAKTVKALVADGLARTEPHPDDKRKLLVHITDRGRDLLDAERNRRAGTLNAAIGEALTDDERLRLRDCVGLLNRLTARLRGASWHPAPEYRRLRHRQALQPVEDDRGRVARTRAGPPVEEESSAPSPWAQAAPPGWAP